LMSVGGEKYVKTDLCEIDLRECQLGKVNVMYFDVDENDRVFYFNEKKHELVIFTKNGKIENRVDLHRTFSKNDFDYGFIRLRVKKSIAVIYPSWRGRKTHYVNLKTSEQKTIECEISTKQNCTYFDEKLLNFETGQVVQVNPFNRPRGVQVYFQAFEKEEVCGSECDGGCVFVFGLKGSKKRTQNYYDDCFYFVRIQTIDTNGDVYAVYKQREMIEEDGEMIVKKVNMKLKKFGKELEELFDWEGNGFYVNEETRTVYTLKFIENSNSGVLKFEKWVLQD